MREWTDQQKEVICSGAKRLICSAAAGSGKTAVMIERAVRFLREGTDPETMLIVTFTNAAASEMRDKLRTRLQEEQEDPNLRAALEKLNMMDISTIHSFCQHLIRQEFQTAQIDPLFRVCDTGRRNSLFAQAFREACDELQQERNPSFLYFKKAFDTKQAEELVRELYDFMMSLPDPFAWLAESCAEIPADLDPSHPWFRTAAEIVREKLKEADVLLLYQYRMFEEPEHLEPYRALWTADSELFHVKQLYLAGEEVAGESLFRDFRQAPRTTGLNRLEADWKERYQALRKKCKAIDEEIRELLRPDPEKTSREFERIRELLAGLRVITEKTADAFSRAKAELRLADFSDLEHLALKILASESSAAAVRRRWRVVFVDECQDVSKVQDAIIRKLAGTENSLFMVGDVKQSIYRFRLADPRLFLDHIRKGRRREDGEECLDLQTNFRSRREILETANRVFEDVMTETAAEVEYTEQEKLKAGRAGDTGFYPVLVDLVAPEEKKKWESAADRAALRMRELREEGLGFRDMVILMPAVSGDGPRLAELLEKRGIPVFFDGGKEFYELPEVETFLNLVSWIDRPYQDGKLISVLKNAPFWFSEEELAQVRLAKMDRGSPFTEAYRVCAGSDLPVGRRCAAAEEKLRYWRELSGNMRLGAFLRFLAGDSQLYAASGAAPAGSSAQGNLRVLCRQAEQAEENGVHTLRGFLDAVSAQAGGGDQRAASSLAEGDDVVRIMTIHKSKGLQFPVVFLLGLERSVKGRASTGAACMDAELGLCLRYKDPERRVSRKTAADRIFEWKKGKEELAERIRLLYVAMTRAQERMIIIGVTEEKTLWQMPKGEPRVLAAETYLDFIMPALYDSEKESTGCAQAGKPWKITVVDQTEDQAVDNSDDNYPLEEWLDSLLSARHVDELWKNEIQEKAVERTVKMSVTALVSQARSRLRDPEDEEETPRDKRIPDRLAEALKRNSLAPYPAFMMPQPEKRGAWRGTVFHRFLALVSLDRVREGAWKDPARMRALAEEMAAEGVLEREEADVLREEEICGFFASELGQRLLAASEVRREWGFNLYREDRNMLLQGVIDCVFLEDGAWILLDYKTDRVEDGAAFTENYRPQLEWYEAALRQLTDRPVREKWLYALGPGKAFRIP